MKTPDGDPFDAETTTNGERTSEDGPGVEALLLLVGAGLFVFPEPVTSWVGATLVVVGAVAWLARFAVG